MRLISYLFSQILILKCLMLFFAQAFLVYSVSNIHSKFRGILQKKHPQFEKLNMLNMLEEVIIAF